MTTDAVSLFLALLAVVAQVAVASAVVLAVGCQREIPLLADHLADDGLPAGLDLVTVATSTDTNRPNYPPSAWLESVGWTAPTLADSPEGAAAVALGLPGYPYFVAVDSQGRVVARTSGEITSDQFDQLVRLATG